MTSSLARIRNAKKFSTVSCILRIMQYLSTIAIFLLGHRSIEDILIDSDYLAALLELISTLKILKSTPGAAYESRTN
jgi:hypothetical protein